MHLIVPILALLQSDGLPAFGPAVGIVAPRNARTPVRVDPIERQFLSQPDWVPKSGDTVGSSKWTPMETPEPGKFSGEPLRGGYVYTQVESPLDQIVFLEARGHSLVYVNGEPRGGDPYDNGSLSLPIELKKGTNRFLFVGGRGSLSAKFARPAAPLSFHLADPTLPDVIEGQPEAAWGAVVIRNASAQMAEPYDIEVKSSKGARRTTRGWPIGPLTIRKVGFEMPLDGSETYSLEIKQNRKVVDKTEVKLRTRKSTDPHKVTFRSDIDGSVQYYGVNPSTTTGSGQALFLSLHGASVEAIGQAEAYAPKRWGYLIAPTNRRPFGFDWEDTGRHDAIEVLRHAQQRFETDPTRTYLTGHSMGGHGTWQLGAHFPSRFAAIAPSAGWISFWTYAGGASYPNLNDVEKMLLRAMSPSDTLALKSNYAQQGIYIVHGDADDNVPVAQARTMRKELEGWHKDLQWHEQPGAGHWWESSDERGADCVDWPGIFAMFSRRRIPTPAEVVDLDFATCSPGVSSECQWVNVLQQLRPWETSRVQLKAEPWKRRIVGTTQNVRTMDLFFDAIQPGGDITIEIDGTKLEKIPNRRIGVTLARGTKGWEISKPLPTSQKNPTRYGGWKDVFRNRVAFVYGTGGSSAENRWSYAKARYDAESWTYRANGSLDVVPDTAWEGDDDRNLVVYGNGVTNRAFNKVADWPIALAPGQLSLPSGAVKSEELAIFQIAPRKGSKVASAAMVGGTGLVGMRLTERVPFLVSGASMPDVFVLQPASLLEGTKRGVFAGFFDHEWKTAQGEFASNLSP